jgi:hypothetical protein
LLALETAGPVVLADLVEKGQRRHRLAPEPASTRASPPFRHRQVGRR